jgi:putative MATE family efflux protein
MKTATHQIIREGSWLDRKLTDWLSSSQFTYREILTMLVPMILDQMFIYLMNMLTAALVSASSETSLSGVSLVNPIIYLTMSVFTAIANGGCVIVAQYKGRGDQEKMLFAAGQTVMATFAFATVVSTILVFAASPLVETLFGGAETEIKLKAIEYLQGHSLTLIPFSLFASGSAVFRGIGASKICLKLTIFINLIHLTLSIVFLNFMHLDLLGSNMSWMSARLLGGAAAMYLMMNKRSPIRVRMRHILAWDFPILKSVFRQGIPYALEQCCIYGGNLIVQIYMVELGSLAIAANAVCVHLQGWISAPVLAVGTLAITVVGQCVGAGDRDLARAYGKKINRLGFVIVLLSIVVLYPTTPLMMAVFAPRAETVALIYQLLLISVIPMPFFFVYSSVLPNILRAAGDATFSSVVSLTTMWAVRVGLGYLVGIPLGFGIQGVWAVMAFEWLVRSVIFLFRFRGKKWLTKHAID